MIPDNIGECDLLGSIHEEFPAGVTGVQTMTEKTARHYDPLPLFVHWLAPLWLAGMLLLTACASPGFEK
jgi:hypothetical protein